MLSPNRPYSAKMKFQVSVAMTTTTIGRHDRLHPRYELNRIYSVELWPPNIQDFPIDAHLLEAPPVESFWICIGFDGILGAITQALYIRFTSNLGCSLSA